MTKLHEFTDANFEQEVLQASETQPVLVDFWAPWCGPCRILGPEIDKVAQSTQGQAIVGKLNIDDAPETTRQYGIRSIPTVLIIRDREIVESFAGVAAAADYLRALQTASSNAA